MESVNKLLYNNQLIRSNLNVFEKRVFGSSHLPHTVYSELLNSNNILGYVFKFELDIWRRNNLTSERWVSEQELECSAVLFTESMHCTNKTKFDADATGIGMSMLNSFLFFLRTVFIVFHWNSHYTWCCASFYTFLTQNLTFFIQTANIKCSYF